MRCIAYLIGRGGAAPEFARNGRRQMRAVNGESGSISLSWMAVPNAVSYRVLRNDFGCSYSFSPVAALPGTSYTDTGLAGLTCYYRIQAVGSNSAFDGPVSACQAAQVACLDADGDGDGHGICGGDCNDANPAVWAVPGEAENLLWSGDGQGPTYREILPLARVCW